MIVTEIRDDEGEYVVFTQQAEVYFTLQLYFLKKCFIHQSLFHFSVYLTVADYHYYYYYYCLMFVSIQTNLFQ